jgi:hypothetical protein
VKKSKFLKNKFVIITAICGIILIGIFTILVLTNRNNNNAQNKNNAQNNNENKEEQKEVTFPYTVDKGRVRYKLVINNNEVKTENYPFKLNEEDKGSYYPIKDVLKYFGIESLNSEDNTILTSKINGTIIRVDADQGKMKYGRQTLEALDKSVKTILVDNVLYVPSFFFMNLTDISIVDYSNDGTSATLTTDLVVNLGTSGISGLSITETNSNGSTVASNGYHICSKCGGAGGYNQEYFDQYMVNGRWQQVRKYRWETCPVCGGNGHTR